MAKTVMTPVTVMRLTVNQLTKRVSTAAKAAEFFSVVKANNWWMSVGHTYSDTVPQVRYDRLTMFRNKIYRRSLPIFKKYLP